ncbi:hypothetical protein BSKO_01927 [Bryopsis sp. KO-2023]|nr:hypothetical protein BSKO_01927 [Bryopsis sp. KO-2023]
MASARPFQVIVWGATGFTGKLVCEHIAAEYQGKLKWAMAGRNQGKLEGVRKDLSSINELCKDVPIVVADSADQSSVDEMVSQADVVVACAGPFAKYTATVVDASVRHGTHYCDITGEVLWVRDNIRKYHDEAKEKKVKIVHCCGFDSIPSDLGTFFVTHHVRNTLNKGCKSVEALVEDMQGAASGGTIYTIMDMMAGMTKEKGKLLADPYSLDPPDSRRGRDTQAALTPFYSSNAETWTSPFIMEGVNSRVVRRSNALLDNAYGKDFGYIEAMKNGGFLSAAMGSLMYIGVGVVFAFRWGQALAMKFLPSPGEGPTKEQQLNGSFKFRYVAETEEPEGGKPEKVVATMGVTGFDPGYWGTARMVLECALCQVFDSEKLKEQGVMEGGVLTPATAFGMVAVERLRAAGFKFDIVSDGKST